MSCCHNKNRYTYSDVKNHLLRAYIIFEFKVLIRSLEILQNASMLFGSQVRPHPHMMHSYLPFGITV